MTTVPTSRLSLVLIRPAELWALAHRLRAMAGKLSDSGRRIEDARTGTVLNPADPRFVPSSLATRTAAVRLGLRRAATLSHDDANLATDSANRAAWGDGLICVFPSRVDDAADLIDPVLRSALARGAGNLVHLADQWLPDNGPVAGDPGGTYSTRPVSIAAPGTGQPATRPATGLPPARYLIADALAATANVHSLGHDEFGLIRHGSRQFTVVLPGVIDLSQPTIGWNPVHRSVRDLDMAAIPSSRSSTVADNRYARMVAQALKAVGVGPGADLLLVGHSFGADTALDLAADAGFAGRYAISGVVATGYYSQPQLRSVDPTVPVLLLQNSRDMVVKAESLMPGPGNRSIHCPSHDHRARTGPPRRNRHVVVEFDGGWAGLGHAPDNYRDVFLGSVGLDPARGAKLAAFTAALSQRGYGPASTMVAVDVSVPVPVPGDNVSAAATGNRQKGRKSALGLGRSAYP